MAFLTAIFHHQRVAVFPNFVDEIEHQLFHDEIAEPDHDQGNNEQRIGRRVVLRFAKK
jgi:hypothetical protein